MEYYKKLMKDKENGKQFDWNAITKEDLEILSIDHELADSVIGIIYDVSKEAVRYKRRKFDINTNNPKYRYRSIKNNYKDLFDNLNHDSKTRLLDKANMDRITIALTHYIFRNGPVEDMHANNQLSENDMKKLNKFMVNQLYNILSLIYEGDWVKLEVLFNILSFYGRDWDKPECDMEEIDQLFEIYMKSHQK